MLHINDLTFRVGARLLFDGATVHVPKGHKVGLVGRNGTGKSTLFKLITGELPSDSSLLTILSTSLVCRSTIRSAKSKILKTS